jgi:hypothetical protein
MTKGDLFLAAIRLLREQLGREPTVDDMIAFTMDYQKMEQRERAKLRRLTRDLQRERVRLRRAH